jgi:HK97 family phage major capsid protein
MNKRLQALLQQRAAAVAAMTKIHTEAGDAALSAEQQAAFDAGQASLVALDADIARVKAAIEAERGGSALVLPDNTRIETGVDRRTLDATHGFRSLADFCTAAHAAQLRGVQDDRLQFGSISDDARGPRFGAAATTYGNEGSIADGGFLVPPEYSREVWQHSLEEDAFLPMCDGQSISGNTMAYPKDETTPWGTDGVRAYWENEAAAATQTKPKGEVNSLRLKRLTALVPVTDELQADGVAVGSYVASKASQSIRWKTNLALFSGSGVGQPEGIFGSAARVDVAKETSQTADTVNATNIAKMFARQVNPRGAVWMINPDVLPQLVVMTIGNQPIWTAPTSGMAQAPLGFLLGRPIIATDVMDTVGDVGDIGFINWKYQRAITKATGIETAQSMHFYFDQNMNAWRFTFRVDAKPVLTAAVTPPNSSATRSPFVFLAERA